MSQERTEAVVMRGVDFSETSRIITFLTPDRGRLTCMAKGARRKQSPLAPALDTFNRLEIVYYWKDGRAIQQLGEASVLDGFAGIKSRLEKAVFASFPLELAEKVAHDNEPSRELYATLVRGLEKLVEWTGDTRAHACWQVVQLLSAAGFEPTLDACVDCARTVSGAPGFAYRGGVTCPACVADVRLTAEQHAIMRALVRERDACPLVGDARSVYVIVRTYAARQLEVDFRSVRVIDEMFNTSVRPGGRG